MLGLEQLSPEDRKVVARARRLERFLTQPFFTTEQFTGLEGKLVSLEDALDGCERILRDEFKDYPESALYMIGRSTRRRRRPGTGPSPSGTTARARMPPARMKLKVLLPFQVFAEKTGVSRIVAETREGSFGLLPHRLDCVAALAPGILIYETEAEGEVFVAVDEGVLVKTGPDVLVSVRRALAAPTSAACARAVEQEFLALDEREQQRARGHGQAGNRIPAAPRGFDHD